MPEPTNSELMTAIHAVAGAVSGMGVRFGGLETRFDGLETRFDGLEVRLSELEARFSAIETRLDRVEAAVERNGAMILDVRTATMDRMDRLQVAIEQLRSEMTVNWATADTAIRHGRERQEELRNLYDMIGGLQRQYRLLAVRVDDLSLPKH